MRCMVRKLIISALNDFLELRREDVEKARERAKLWNDRARKFTALMGSLLAKLDDGKVTDDEVTELVREIQAVAGEWM